MTTIHTDFQVKAVLYFAACVTILLTQQSFCFTPTSFHSDSSNAMCSSCCTTKNRQFQSLHVPQTILFQPLYSSKASSRKKGHRRNANHNKRPHKQGFHQSHVDTEPAAVEFDVHQESLSPEELNLHHAISNHNVQGSRADHEYTKRQMHHVHSQQHHPEHHHHHQQQQSILHQPAIKSFSKPMSNLLRHIIAPHDQNKKLVSNTPEWKRLVKHAEYIKQTHLRDLLLDEDRSDKLFAEYDGLYLDYSRQRVTLETMDLLFDLAKKQELKKKIDAMVTGEKINWTENRAVLHTALRSERNKDGSDDRRIIVDGEDVIEEVWDVLDQIKYFTEAVRSGEIRGFTGKRLRNIISVGIGGSYLGPEFLHECLKTEPEGINKSLGYTLRFLSNVDPVDVERACADLDPEETLVVIVSKTFTTSETMLNARTTRQWLWDFMGDDKEVVRKHMVAVSSISSIERVEAFGIDTEKYFFRFWDWVGGRYSVCSAVGGIPISLLYGFDLFEKFLHGARSIDEHFINAPFKENIPVIMGLLGVWNMSFLGYTSRTTLPYAEALLKLPAHIQQLDMESNGKKATKHGIPVDYPVGEVDFGEPGTNGQHSFFQLLHMGQIVPCEFIGFLQSQHDLCIDGELLSSHDELMANFFAQPDALANGKTAEEVRAEGVDEDLIIHRTFEGNRPSLSLLAPKLTAYSCGQLLALYEHRTAVQGFIWDINSFDQWGVELGKKLACDVKDHLLDARKTGKTIKAGNPATSRILNYYVQNSQQAIGEELWDSNPLTSVTRKTHHDKDFLPPVRHDLKGTNGKLT